jgi:hypothetical protein
MEGKRENNRDRSWKLLEKRHMTKIKAGAGLSILMMVLMALSGLTPKPNFLVASKERPAINPTLLSLALR